MPSGEIRGCCKGGPGQIWPEDLSVHRSGDGVKAPALVVRVRATERNQAMRLRGTRAIGASAALSAPGCREHQGEAVGSY